jgi:hypothetical protein
MNRTHCIVLDNELRSRWFNQGGFSVSRALYISAHWGSALRASVRPQDVLF